MTKQEVYDGLVAKFDKVQPINEWVKRNAVVLGVVRYEFSAFNKVGGYTPLTLFVENDGESNEDAYFVQNDPIAEKPEPTIPFTVKIQGEIASRKEAGQIVEGFILQDKTGPNVCEIRVYKESGSDLTSDTYVVWEKADETLGFKKLV